MPGSSFIPFLVAALLASLVVSTGCTQAPATIPGNTTVTPVLLKTVPDVRQSQNFSCGAASLQAVLNYWGIDEREGELIRQMGTTSESGTPPEAIVSAARAHGLDASLGTNLTLADLESSVAAGVPVITASQAWRDPEEANQSWENIWEDGHYMVVIGIDSNNLYFEDPALLGTRGVIPRQEFLARWHDYEGVPPFSNTSRILNHAGILIRGKEPALYPAFTHVD